MNRRSIVYGQRKNGTKFPAEISISKIKVNGKLEFTAIVRDISERELLLEELHHQATTDGLTGAKNRLFFEQELKLLVKRVPSYHADLSLLLIDLDHFKLVNDSHGHGVGDQVLIGFVQAVADVLDESHTFARYGGEEFIILLPDFTQIQANELAQNICRICADKRHVRNITSTVSIGVSAFNPELDDCESFIHRADMALYQAKSQGRNQVQIHICDSSSKEHS